MPPRIFSAGNLRLGAIATAVLTTACADEQDECEGPLQICDIANADCRDHVFVQTACAREHEGRTVPPVVTITRDAFEDILRAEHEPTADEQREDAQVATALRMLALLEPGTESSEDAAISSYVTRVLAFYTRDDASVTLIEENLAGVSDKSAVFVLSHEFVHAQQDVDVGLQNFFDEFATSTDSIIALRSVSEGEAVHDSNLTLARVEGGSLDESDAIDFFEDQQASLREAAADPAETDYTDLVTAFPYSFGAELVARTWFDGGREGVFGIYDDPPRSSADVLRAVELQTSRALEVPALAVDTLPEGWSMVLEDTFGAWVMLAVASRANVSGIDAGALALDWIGDRILVFGGPEPTDVAVVWRIRLSGAASAQAVARIGETQPPEGMRLIRVDGNDVTMVLATGAEMLATWEDAVAAAVDSGPRLRETRPGLERPRRTWLDPRFVARALMQRR